MTKRLLLVTGVVVLVACLITGFRLMRPSRETTIDLTGLATPGHPVASPSGRFTLEAREETIANVKHWRFAITGGEKVFVPAEAFRTRDALFMLWDEQDRVWVYSGDVATFFWEQAGDGEWQKHLHADEPVPPRLKELRPNYFH